MLFEDDDVEFQCGQQLQPCPHNLSSQKKKKEKQIRLSSTAYGLVRKAKTEIVRLAGLRNRSGDRRTN